MIKKFHFDMSGKKFSNIKGYIGTIVASQFLGETYFKKTIFHSSIITPYKLEDIKFNWLSEKQARIIHIIKINEKDLKKKLYNEDFKKLVDFFNKFKDSYHPDYFLAVNGKLYVVEVKMNEAKLKNYQKKDLLKMRSFGFPVLVVYIKMNSFIDYEIGLEEL